MKFSISSKEITYWLLMIVIALNAIGFVGRTIEYLLGCEGTTAIVRLFHVGQEGNITTWYSSFSLLFSAILLGIIARARHTHGDPYLRHWSALSIIFFYLSLDEAAGIHEMTIRPLRSIFHPTGIFHYAWVIIAIPLLLFFLILYRRFLYALPRNTRRLFIVAGTVYVIGALGMDLVGGYFSTREVWHWDIIPILITIEELLENVGIVVFISALLSYLSSHQQVNEISIEFVR